MSPLQVAFVRFVLGLFFWLACLAAAWCVWCAAWADVPAYLVVAVGSGIALVNAGSLSDVT